MVAFISAVDHYWLLRQSLRTMIIDAGVASCSSGSAAEAGFRALNGRFHAISSTSQPTARRL